MQCPHHFLPSNMTFQSLNSTLYIIQKKSFAKYLTEAYFDPQYRAIFYQGRVHVHTTLSAMNIRKELYIYNLCVFYAQQT